MSKDIDLTRYTEDELRALNRRIVERLKLLQQKRCVKQLERFATGDVVSFTPEDGRVVVGIVVRLNKKTATVSSSDGQQWRVSPALLSRVEDAQVLGDGEGGVVVSFHGKRR